MVNTITSYITTATDVFTATNDDGYGYSKVQIVQQRGDNINAIITVNAVFYIAEADFTTGTFFTLGTIDEAVCRPNNQISIAGPEVINAAAYLDGDGVAFAGTQVLDKVALSISPAGAISVYVGTVTTPATLASVDHVIIPVSISFTNLLEDVVTIPL